MYEAAQQTAPAPPFSSAKSRDRKSTRLNSSHSQISYAVLCLKKKHPNENPLLDLLRKLNRPHLPRSALHKPAATRLVTRTHAISLSRTLPFYNTLLTDPITYS